MIVKEEKLAPDASAFNGSAELAGDFTIVVRAFPDTDMNAVHAAVLRAFSRFETEGVSPEELRRVKAGHETAFYDNLGSALGKAFELARYNTLAGDPGFVTEDITRALAVTGEDVMRVYDTYIKGKPFVASSFVPKGQANLVLAGSEKAFVVEERIVSGEGEFDAFVRGDVPKTPSSFDRSVEPRFGPPPSLSAPDVWRLALDNGLEVLGIEDREIPLVRFELRIQGGLRAENPERIGAVNLLAETMMQGTARRTPEELEQASYRALAATDPQFYPATVMNYRLGGGGFASDLMQVLREEKGYTYGARSRFSGSDIPGPFTISTSVRSNATLESLELVARMLGSYGPEFDAEDLSVSRSFLLKTNAGAFETLEDKLGILADMSLLGFPADYLLEREKITKGMTVERIRELAARHLDPKRMIWLVVGDADTQVERLGTLGLGAPVIVDREGNPVAEKAE